MAEQQRPGGNLADERRLGDYPNRRRTNPGPSWHVIGSGDFNGDGLSDILWQNSDRSVAIWEMNGTTPTLEALVAGNPGPSWHAIGSGGNSDILWQNDNGAVAVREMNGTTVIGASSIGNPGPSWHVVGTGDYNGNGFSDIRFQNTSGQPGIWLMDGTTPIGEELTGSNPEPSWHVEGDSAAWRNAGADLLWQSDVTASVLFQNDDGTAAIWQTSGTAITGSAIFGDPGPSWHLKATGDFTGTGNPALLWQNDDGSAAIWEPTAAR